MTNVNNKHTKPKNRNNKCPIFENLNNTILLKLIKMKILCMCFKFYIFIIENSWEKF